MEGRPAVRAIRRPEASPVRFDRGTTNGKPHAHAATARGHEGVEQVGGDVLGNAGAGVFDLDQYPAFDVGPGAQYERARTLHGRHRADCIAHEVQHHLLQLDAVAAGCGRVGCDIDTQHDV